MPIVSTTLAAATAAAAATTSPTSKSFLSFGLMNNIDVAGGVVNPPRGNIDAAGKSISAASRGVRCIRNHTSVISGGIIPSAALPCARIHAAATPLRTIAENPTEPHPTAHFRTSAISGGSYPPAASPCPRIRAAASSVRSAPEFSVESRLTARFGDPTAAFTRQHSHSPSISGRDLSSFLRSVTIKRDSGRKFRFLFAALIPGEKSGSDGLALASEVCEQHQVGSKETLARSVNVSLSESSERRESDANSQSEDEDWSAKSFTQNGCFANSEQQEEGDKPEVGDAEKEEREEEEDGSIESPEEEGDWVWDEQKFLQARARGKECARDLLSVIESGELGFDGWCRSRRLQGRSRGFRGDRVGVGLRGGLRGGSRGNLKGSLRGRIRGNPRDNLRGGLRRLFSKRKSFDRGLNVRQSSSPAGSLLSCALQRGRWRGTGGVELRNRRKRRAALLQRLLPVLQPDNSSRVGTRGVEDGDVLAGSSDRDAALQLVCALENAAVRGRAEGRWAKRRGAKGIGANRIGANGRGAKGKAGKRRFIRRSKGCAAHDLNRRVHSLISHPPPALMRLAALTAATFPPAASNSPYASDSSQASDAAGCDGPSRSQLSEFREAFRREVLTPLPLSVPDVDGSVAARCQLTSSTVFYRFKDNDVNLFFALLFHTIAGFSSQAIVSSPSCLSSSSPSSLPSSSPPTAPSTIHLSRFDLFHCHLFAAHSSGRLGALFHAKEYPAYCSDSFPVNLGFCQSGSPVPYDGSMSFRNILWLAPFHASWCRSTGASSRSGSSCSSSSLGGKGRVGTSTREGTAACTESAVGWFLGSDTYLPGSLHILETTPKSILHEELVCEGLKLTHTIYESDFGFPLLDVNYFTTDKSLYYSNRIFVC